MQLAFYAKDPGRYIQVFQDISFSTERPIYVVLENEVVGYKMIVDTIKRSYASFVQWRTSPVDWSSYSENKSLSDRGYEELWHEVGMGHLKG